MRALIALPLLLALQAHAPAEPLKRLQTVELPGVEGRIDHLALDSASHQLFIAALGNNTVEVVDVEKGIHLKSLPGFREPQGIAVASAAHLIAVANGHGEGVQMLNVSDYHAGPTTSLGDDADNVRYDASAERLYVGYGGGALAALNA